MDPLTPRRLPDGEELVVDPDFLPARLRPLDDDPRAASLRRRQAASAGKLGDRGPRTTWSAPRKPSEG
jgi:hypothetical protein